jgi:SET domain-containing protein
MNSLLASGTTKFARQALSERNPHSPLIFIGKASGKGRGVFARVSICRDQTIEESPVVVVPASEVELLDRTSLADYYFLWGEDESEAALLLGLCSLCNHSFDPNSVFILRPERLTIEFSALRDIQPGEEITINYNGNPEDPTPIWFSHIE